MKISVVIPAYNEEAYLPECLAGIRNQIRQPDEVIVVDNNSTDATPAIARKYGARVIKEKNKGIAWTRNTGFNSATGDIIVRVDADTRLFPDWIQKAETHFTKSSVDAIAGKNNYDTFSKDFDSLYTTYHRVAKYINNNTPVMSGSNFALRKSTWNSIRKTLDMSFAELVMEDIHLSIAIRKRGGTILRDHSMQAITSGRRRSRNPLSFYIEYPSKILLSYLIS
ncbi:MAG: glycosyltransferase [Patescibacteria group bacterium]|nr:glycosyltransferase [Patescibacteria group bacterium]